MCIYFINWLVENIAVFNDKFSNYICSTWFVLPRVFVANAFIFTPPPNLLSGVEALGIQGFYKCCPLVAVFFN